MDHYAHSISSISSLPFEKDRQQDEASPLCFLSSVSSLNSAPRNSRRSSDSAITLKKSPCPGPRKQRQMSEIVNSTTKKFQLGWPKLTPNTLRPRRRSSLLAKLGLLSEQLASISSELDTPEEFATNNQEMRNTGHDDDDEVESSHSTCGTIETCISETTTSGWEEDDESSFTAVWDSPPCSPTPSAVLHSIPRCCPPLVPPSCSLQQGRSIAVVDKLPSDLYFPCL